jgi:TonB family protein
LGDQDFGYDNAGWGHYYPNMQTAVRRKVLLTANLVSKEYMSVNELEQKMATYPLSQRLVIGPVIESDLDKDGNKEAFRVFISNGAIINYEIFENSKTGLVKVELTDVWKQNVKKHAFVANMLLLSKDTAFYSPYEELQVMEVAGEDIYWDVDIPVPVEVVEAPREEEILSFASELPVYPGGTDGMMKDLNANLVYPEMEKENGIQGNVYVGFVVEKDGSITNVEVKRGVSGGPGLTKAAEAAVKKLKKFETPAKNNGKPVRYQYTLPVKFKLD